MDSYGLKELGGGDCAAIYGQKTPDKNAARPPEQWQTYDITFRAPRFDQSGQLKEKARITVLWNGVKVHDNVEINGPTGGGDTDVKNPGPIRLQDHGCPDRFRNIWIVPAK